MGKAFAIAIILIAFAVTYWRPLRRVRTALGFDHLVSTGHAFLILGYLLGLVFGGRPTLLIDDLSPIVAFVAGWVGFATGMRFDLRVLRTIPRRAFAAGLVPAVFAAILVGTASAGLLLSRGIPEAEAMAASLVLAAAAASSGPTLVAMVRARRPGRSSRARPVLRMIEFSASIDDFIVILLAMLAFAMFRSVDEPVAIGWLLMVALGGGALLGGITWLFLGGRATEDERLLLGLAMLAFIAGFAGWLRLSPAAVAAISAIVLVNLPGERITQLLDAVRRVERPAVVILMTGIGFLVTGHTGWILLPLVAAMTLLRLAANRWSGDLFAGRLSESRGLSTTRHWGDGLTSQGNLGLMVSLSFFQVWRDDIAKIVLAAVAVSSLINELLAPWLLFRLLKAISPAEPRPEPVQENAG